MCRLNLHQSVADGAQHADITLKHRGILARGFGRNDNKAIRFAQVSGKNIGCIFTKQIDVGSTKRENGDAFRLEKGIGRSANKAGGAQNDDTFGVRGHIVTMSQHGRLFILDGGGSGDSIGPHPGYDAENPLAPFKPGKD